MMKSANCEDDRKANGEQQGHQVASVGDNGAVATGNGDPVPSHMLSPASQASLHPSLMSSSLSPGSAGTPATLATLQVPLATGQGPRPSVPAQARRGTNVAVSKRTRFALNVQKPTGETGSDNDSVVTMDNGVVPAVPPVPVAVTRGAEVHRPGHQQQQPVNGHPPGPGVVRGRGRGRGGPRGGARGGGGVGVDPRQQMSGQQLRQKFGNNVNGGQQQIDSGTDNDSSSLVQQPEYNKLKMRPVPDQRVAPSQSCSPITLEYAEELLLMAYDGRCSVMDVSAVAKECPSGGYVYIYHSPEMPYAWKNDDGYKWSEILHQMDMTTAKGNKIDYYHFYIELPGKKPGEKKRSSPNFRKEAYKMSDYTLVAYIGDQNVVEKREETLKQKRDKILGSLSMHANLQEMAINRSNQSKVVSGVNNIHGRGYNTISGVSSNKQLNPLPRKQRSQSLERARSPTYRNNKEEVKPFPFPGLGHVSPSQLYISDPDMLASKLVEQEYLQSLDHAKSAKKQDVFYQLWELANDLSNGKFVKNISIYPALQLTLVHPDMTREFENICKILYSERCPGDLEDETMKLFYDMTFELGDRFVTILTFTNYFYVGCPVMPLAVNIHERKFKSSHSLFWARILCDIPALAKYRFPIVINEAEPAVHLAVKAHAPNLIQFEGWVHRFKDMDKYMRQKGYGAHAVGYFKACIKYLLMSDSRGEMIDKFQKEFEGIWPRDFVNYFKERVLPKANRLGKWALGEVNIFDESFFNHAGSPQERFHLRCNQFQGWESLGIIKMVEAFYLLMTYYVNESSSAKAGQGAFAIHPDLKSLFCELLPENLPFNNVPPPSEIVEYLRLQSGDNTGNILAVKEKEELYSPGYHFSNSATDCLPFNFNASTFSFASDRTDSKFLLNSSEFELSASTAVPPSWLSNGSDILAVALSEDDREGHVPSPAPGDTSNCLHSPQRKLSVIPEVPGFSRPPSLAELAASKQKSSNNSLEIIVSGAKETSSSNIIRQANNNNLFYPASAIPRGLVGYERLQQHSIESSVVTEGHYDASFEDGDMVASFDVDQQNYVYLDEQQPTILSNGHFKMSQQEMKMLGIKDVITSNGGLGEGKMNSSSNGRFPDIDDGQIPTTTTSSTAVPTSQQQANGSSSHRKGELNIQSIPSEVELVTQAQNNDSQLQSTIITTTTTAGSVHNSSCVKTESQTSSGDKSGQTMLWKRIRHTVVFGGKVNKSKKEQKD